MRHAPHTIRSARHHRPPPPLSTDCALFLDIDGTLAELVDDPREYGRMSRIENPYGDGLASGRIAARLSADHSGGGPRPLPCAAPIEGSYSGSLGEPQP